LLKVNTEQKDKIANLKSQTDSLKTHGINETMKVDELDQYGQRQNLEIVGVPQKENEDTNEII